MNATLNSHLAAAIVADRHNRAAQWRLVRLAETGSRTSAASSPEHIPTHRRLRLRRATA